jgi:hypothetical protein
MADVPNFLVQIRRPDDLLVLSFEGVNLRLDREDPAGPRIVRTDPSLDSYLVVHLPPQHIDERAFRETQTQQDPLEAPPVAARIAGETRLVFRLPPGIDGMACSLDALLDWSSLEPVLVPVALPAGASPDVPPTIRAPEPVPTLATQGQSPPPETSIELPYRLILSPDGSGVWEHDASPRTLRARTELWRTRLARRVSDGTVDPRTLPPVRAVWSPDYSPPGEAPPADPEASDPAAVRSLTPNQRHQIVRLTSDFGMTGELVLPFGVPITVDVPPLPLTVWRLHLSALGGTLDSEGSWPSLPEGLDVSEWRHIASFGRDRYVKVVEEGVLYPFGHRAALVQITERKFQAVPGTTTPVGYLRKREFIVVREPFKEFHAADYPHHGLEMPIRSVRLTTLVSPDLDAVPPVVPPGQWVLVGGEPFAFHAVAVDGAGAEVEFTAGLMFVFKDADDIDPTVGNTYRTDSDRRRCAVDGARVRYADPQPGQPGDNTLVTEALRFDVTTPSGPPAPERPVGWQDFRPTLANADVHLEAVEQITGRPAPVSIELYEDYLAGGFAGSAAPNAALVWAKIEPPVGPSFSADRAGGLARPDTTFGAVSQHLGPVASGKTGSLSDAELRDLATGTFDPAQVFSGVAAKLFGTIDLAQLVEEFTDGAPAPAGHYPKLHTAIQRDAQGTPVATVTTLDWTPVTRSVDVGLAKVEVGSDAMTVSVRTERRLDGSPGSSSITGTINSVDLTVAKVIHVHFDTITFSARDGQKPDVHVAMPDGGIEFLGPLSFVDEIRKLIPPGVLGDGPHVDVTPAGVDLGYSLALPPATVAVFTLQDLALSTGLHLPFLDGRMQLSFGISSRDHPFLLAVLIFGGGGFFHIDLGIDGVDRIEAAFEFGGLFALDLGVASGGVSVMGGIYLKGDKSGTTLEGFFRLDGEVDVLGLISVTVEFYLSLSYDFDSGKARGQATLTIGVHVAFFSTSVDLTVEKSFGGGGEDPAFGQGVTAADWEAYDRAFA